MAREDSYTTQIDCEGGTWQKLFVDGATHFFHTNPAIPVTDRIWLTPAAGTNLGPGSWAYNRFSYGTVVDDPYHIPHTLPINASPLPSPNSCLP